MNLAAVRTPPIRIAAVAATPGYYHTPLYRCVSQDPRAVLRVFYASDQGLRAHDPGFGIGQIEWKIEDQLANYDSEFLRRASSLEPGDGLLSLRNWDVGHALARYQPDVLWINGYSFLTSWLAAAWARRRGIPVLFREEQTLLDRRPRLRSALRALALKALFQDAYALYISTANRDFFLHYGIRPQRLFFSPYCAVPTGDGPARGTFTRDRTAIRARLGIVAPPDVPVVLFVGKLTAKKQPLLLLDAFQRVRSDVQCTLLVVGDGEQREAMGEAVASRHVPDVVFTGFLNRDAIPLAYAAADLLVLPSSHRETFGLVVAEAMQWGLPVIVSDKVGCAADLVQPGENGFVVRHDSVDELASAIRDLVANAGLRAAFGRRSEQTIAAWSYRNAAQGVLAASLAATGAQAP